MHEAVRRKPGGFFIFMAAETLLDGAEQPFKCVGSNPSGHMRRTARHALR